ncbi:Trs85p ASCRUDRAFT_109019 [Ascoidea rubescens DSM 1968]|uniref:Uncharacterized protein n=1 Tax=Ascoidea rubescens DSM 1968 TaxID=1344418 RepID=A0A1D2VEQ5_9ASCO|nr:hypothetical protein ASCRUDRAFT_109019 [Ascoidea rubescens DSM 1968]ODV59983.1 hypothetical protein ASCRUDRAFT_109019 [Ascoidea rubescens DSM 1968]
MDIDLSLNNNSSFFCKDLLVNAFSPNISVIASSNADQLSTEKGFNSFYHLIRPFGYNLKSNYTIRNNDSISQNYSSFSIRFSRPIIDSLNLQQDLFIPSITASNTKNDYTNYNYNSSNTNDTTLNPFNHELFDYESLSEIMINYVNNINKKFIHNNNSHLNLKDDISTINTIKHSIYSNFFSKLISNHLILPFETFNHSIIHLVVVSSNDDLTSINNLLLKNFLSKKVNNLFATTTTTANNLSSPTLARPPISSNFKNLDLNIQKSSSTSNLAATNDSENIIPNYLNLNDDDSLVCFLIISNSNEKDDLTKSQDLLKNLKSAYNYPCLLLKLNEQNDLSNLNYSPNITQNDLSSLSKPKLYCSINEELQTLQLEKFSKRQSSNSINNNDNDNNQNQNQNQNQNNEIDNSNENGNLNSKDISSIKSTLVELIKLTLIPFMEKKISSWDDQYVAPKKSFTNRFFNVFSSSSGLKPLKTSFFGFGTNANKSTSSLSDHLSPPNSSLNNFNNNLNLDYNFTKGYYNYYSHIAKIRKLADWSFMLRNYKHSYQTYELLKKDFQSDKAWSYLASSQEMLIISLLLDVINSTTSYKLSTTNPVPRSSLSSPKSSNSSHSSYNSPSATVKLKQTLIDSIIDASTYSYVSRCNLKSFPVRFLVVISELFNCLKINNYSNLTPGFNPTNNNNLIINSIYSIKYLNKVLDSNLINFKRNFNTNGYNNNHIIRAIIFERICYNYSIYFLNHVKYDKILKKNYLQNKEYISNNLNIPFDTLPLNESELGDRYEKRPIITIDVAKSIDNTDKTNETKEDDKKLILNPYKLEKKNLEFIGLTRFRKFAFLLLLATKEWEHIGNYPQMRLNLNMLLSTVYNVDVNIDIDNIKVNRFLFRDNGLFKKLLQRCEKIENQ